MPSHIARVTGPVSCEVGLGNGLIWKCHLNQLWLQAGDKETDDPGVPGQPVGDGKIEADGPLCGETGGADDRAPNPTPETAVPPLATTPHPSEVHSPGEEDPVLTSPTEGGGALHREISRYQLCDGRRERGADWLTSKTLFVSKCTLGGGAGCVCVLCNWDVSSTAFL